MRASRSIACAVVVGGLLAGAAHAGEATRLSATFDRATLRAAVAIVNTGAEPRSLVQVGVRSEVVGDFRCRPSRPAPLTEADYLIRFQVDGGETTIAADPALPIPRGRTRFTVSLAPDATGACGAWHASVTILAALDDGTVLASDPVRITNRDVRAVADRRPPRAELERGLAHRDEGLRMQAVRQLADVTKDDAVLAKELAPLLDDPSSRVRGAVAAIVGERKLIGAAPALRARLTRAEAALPSPPNEDASEEVLHDAETLVVLRDEEAAALLAALVTDERFGYAGLLADDLGQWPSHAIDAAATAALAHDAAWSAPDASEDHAARYGAMCAILVAHGDAEARALIEAALGDHRHPSLAPVIVRALARAVEQAPDQPLLVALAASAAAAIRRSHDGDGVRIDGFHYLRTLEPATARRVLTAELLRIGLADSSAYVRAEAIRAVDAIGAHELAAEACAATKDVSDYQVNLALGRLGCPPR